MATTKLLLGILFLAFTGSIGMLKRNLLNRAPVQNEARARLVHIAEQEIGVREKTGNNDGPRVLAYLKMVNLHQGDPYCAAYLSWVFAQAGFAKPRSGWCPDLFPTGRITKEALAGNIFGIYFPEKDRIAHVGMIISRDDNWLNTAEGNTSIAGSREGDGVYRKRRNVRTVYRMADWVAVTRSAQPGVLEARK